MTREESGEGCFTVFLENRNVNYLGSKGGKKAHREPVIPRGIEVGRRLRIDCEGGCFSGLDYETQA